MRKGTRDAIYHAVEHLTDNVRTSGAVSFGFVHVRTGMQKLCVYSYSMCIAELYVQDRQAIPTYIVLFRERRSVTTSKHQSWVGGAVNRYWPGVLLVEGCSIEASNCVAADKAMELGWGGIDAMTLERRANYKERNP